MASPIPSLLANGLSAALFDLDGTLITTHIDFPQMRREVASLMARHGVNSPDPLPIDTLAAVREAAEQIRRRTDQRAADGFLAHAGELLQSIEEESCAAPEPIDGAAELLDLLRARRVPVAIVTRNSRSVSESLLDAGGLRCDVMLTRDDVPVTKPDPRHLWSALDHLGLPQSAARATVMVGDHWMDVQGGRAAGMLTIGVLSGRPAGLYSMAPPDLLVEGVRDLIPLVQAQQ